MKVEIEGQSHVKTLEAKDLKVNRLYQIVAVPHGGVGTTYLNSIVFRIKDSIHELRDWEDCWNVGNCTFQYRELNKNEVVKLSQE